ncbi:MAG: hypothetical protein RLZZ501_1758 [Pseudomonadota bacterium]|jgi:RND family efflux transporter MFP subunit
MTAAVRTPGRWRAGAAAGLALALLAGCDEPKPPAEPALRPVRAEPARAVAVQDFPALVGEVRPHFESDLGFKVAGRVAWRLNRLGAVVRRDEVVARLDEQDQRNQLATAQADLASARAGLAQAASEEKRQNTLRNDGWVSQARYESALQARDSAAAQVRAAGARLKLAQDQLGYTQLRAPADGVITALGAEAGQVVGAGQMVLRLARPERRDAVFALAENRLAELPPDAPVEIALLDDPSVRSAGTVTEIAPSADPATRTYAIKVALPDDAEALRFGMSVVGRIQTGARRVIALPAAALFQQNGQPAVWVVDPASRAVALVPVGEVRIESGRLLIGDGLAEGALVVTAGVQTLVPGQKVRLLDAPAAATSAPAGGAGR